MKKLLAVIVMTVFCFVTGCSVKPYVREYDFDENVEYYNLCSPKPDYSQCEAVDDETSSLFEAICEVEKVVLNDAYKLDLKATKIDVFYTDNIQRAVYGHEGQDGVEGYYSVELNQVFLDSDLKNNKAKLMGVMAHEAIHYLYAYNNDTDSQFFTYKEGSKELGDALIEGLTQRIALNVLIVLEERNYCTGAYDAVIRYYYSNTRMADLLCTYAVPNMDRYYLTNDFDSARKDFNDSIGNTLNSEHEPFELLEDAMQKAQKCENEQNLELGMKYAQDAIRLIAFSVKNSSEENKKAFLSEFDSFGCFSDDYSKSIHRLLE